MNALDIAIIIIIFINLYLGWKLRAINMLGMLASLVLGVFAANKFHPQFQEMFSHLPEVAGTLLAWLTVFLITAITITILNNFLSKAFEIIRLRWLDSLIGALFSLILTLFFLSILLNFINNFTHVFHWQIAKKSYLINLIIEITDPISDYTKKLLNIKK